MKKIYLSISFFFGMFFSQLIYSQSITIGKQVWMTQNLNLDKFRNGDPIPQAKTNEEWKKAGENKQPAWCYYDNDPANVEKFGKLYNWYAVNDSRGIAPQGWHVPSDAEWTILTDNLGGTTAAGIKMKSESNWNENGNGDNNSGFAGLPCGRRLNDGRFNSIGYEGYWWTSTDDKSNSAYIRYLNYFNGIVNWDYNLKSKAHGFSVRCIKN
jgi:uncharacterized protein (TIGR02145 family)